VCGTWEDAEGGRETNLKANIVKLAARRAAPPKTLWRDVLQKRTRAVRGLQKAGAVPVNASKSPLLLGEHLANDPQMAPGIVRRNRASPGRGCPMKASGSTPYSHELVYQAQLEDTAQWSNSYTVLPNLIDGFDPARSKRWLKVLGDNWSRFDNVFLHRAKVVRLLNRCRKHWPAMMNSEEAGVLRALPNVVTVFRGCGPYNKNGLSWSINKETAARFPFFHRYRTRQPILVTARVKKSRIIAYKNGRNEQEVIVLIRTTDFLTIEALPAPIAENEEVAQ